MYIELEICWHIATPAFTTTADDDDGGGGCAANGYCNRIDVSTAI